MENINNLAKYLQATLIQKILNNVPENAILEKREINGTIIYKSPEVTAEKYNISRCLYFGKYNDLVIRFSKILEDKFPHCNLSSFYNNISTTDIKDKVDDLLSVIYTLINKDITGFYNSENNVIQLIRLTSVEKYSRILMHELLHLASRKKVGKIILSGFRQVTNQTKMGRYLNEGYTEYLNQKYFSKKDRTAYAEAVTFAQGIERIVGRKKMEKLYFDADLLGLTNELGKYCPTEEIVNLINKIDCYYNQLPHDVDAANRTYEEILINIANIQRTKLSKELAEGKINENEYRKRKLLYCDDYENGRVNTDNVSIQEYEEYFLIIDNDTHESHYYMKHPDDIANHDDNIYNLETNPDEIYQFEISKEAPLLYEFDEMKEEGKRKK